MLVAKENAEKIAFFLDTCRDRKLSPNTLRSYDTALESFYNYATERDLLFEKVDLFQIRSFKKDKLSNYAPTSQNLKLSVVRKFYETLQEFRVLDFNPVSQSFNNKIERKTLTFVPKEHYSLIEKYFIENSSENYLLGLRLMYFSGLRVSEVGAINLINDIVIDQDKKMYLKVHGKGSKERIVPVFSRQAHNQINSFRKNHNSLMPLHLGTNTQTYDYHLKQIALNNNIQKYSCHDFRRGFAVNLYSKTHDIEMLRVLLGHESYNTTLLYIRDATVNVYQLPDSLFA